MLILPPTRRRCRRGVDAPPIRQGFGGCCRASAPTRRQGIVSLRQLRKCRTLYQRVEPQSITIHSASPDPLILSPPLQLTTISAKLTTSPHHSPAVRHRNQPPTCSSRGQNTVHTPSHRPPPFHLTIANRRQTAASTPSPPKAASSKSNTPSKPSSSAAPPSASPPRPAPCSASRNASPPPSSRRRRSRKSSRSTAISGVR